MTVRRCAQLFPLARVRFCSEEISNETPNCRLALHCKVHMSGTWKSKVHQHTSLYASKVQNVFLPNKLKQTQRPVRFILNVAFRLFSLCKCLLASYPCNRS
jgi:hypothetical protein